MYSVTHLVRSSFYVATVGISPPGGRNEPGLRFSPGMSVLKNRGILVRVEGCFRGSFVVQIMSQLQGAPKAPRPGKRFRAQTQGSRLNFRLMFKHSLVQRFKGSPASRRTSESHRHRSYAGPEMGVAHWQP